MLLPRLFSYYIYFQQFIKYQRGFSNADAGRVTHFTHSPPSCRRVVSAVGIKCEKSRNQRKDAKRAEKMRKEPYFMEEKQTLLYHIYKELNRDHTDVINNKCQ